MRIENSFTIYNDLWIYDDYSKDEATKIRNKIQELIDSDAAYEGYSASAVKLGDKWCIHLRCNSLGKNPESFGDLYISLRNGHDRMKDILKKAGVNHEIKP